MGLEALEAELGAESFEPGTLPLPHALARVDEAEPASPDLDPPEEAAGGSAEIEAGPEEDHDLAARAAGRDAPARKEREEGQSFLSMYFHDMAELAVLAPEQEFETARNIEQLELELWRTLLGFAPAAPRTAAVVEKELARPLPDFKTYLTLAARMKGARPATATRAGFQKLVARLSTRIKELDIDRLFVDAVVADLRHVGAAVAGGERPGRDLPFNPATRAFRDHLHAVNRKVSAIKQAKNAFVKANLRLVVSIARRFNHGRLPLPDLIQEGNIGLMKAVERYDYRRGFRFSTYASWWIRHAISRALADKGRAVRLPVHMIDAYHKIAKSERELQSKLERPATTDEIAGATGIEAEKLEKMKTFLADAPISLDRPISDEDGRCLIDILPDPNEGPQAPDQIVTEETHREMLKLLSGLKPIEADILRKRFGLSTDEERTLKEIGEEYHLSRERVRQLQEQALGKMRRAMAKRDAL